MDVRFSSARNESPAEEEQGRRAAGRIDRVEPRVRGRDYEPSGHDNHSFQALGRVAFRPFKSCGDQAECAYGNQAFRGTANRTRAVGRPPSTDGRPSQSSSSHRLNERTSGKRASPGTERNCTDPQDWMCPVSRVVKRPCGCSRRKACRGLADPLVRRSRTRRIASTVEKKRRLAGAVRNVLFGIVVVAVCGAFVWGSVRSRNRTRPSKSRSREPRIALSGATGFRSRPQCSSRGSRGAARSSAPGQSFTRPPQGAWRRTTPLS